MYRLTEEEEDRREARYVQLREEVWASTATHLEEILNEAREEYAGLELRWRHDQCDPKLEQRRKVETAIKLWSGELRSELEAKSNGERRLEDLVLYEGPAEHQALRAAANGLALLLAEREVLKG